MKSERYQFQARRLDDGEIIVGNIIDTGCEGMYIYDGADVHPMDSGIYEIHKIAVEVDPSTIEPVAVAPIAYDSALFAKCPNCNYSLLSPQHHKYCHDCGQRLDWSKAEEQERIDNETD